MNKEVIEHANIFYIPHINVIGGTEQFVYEVSKKYHKFDIAVIYKTGNINQIKRLREYVPVYKYDDQLIKCSKLFCNYSTDIASQIDAKEYIQIIHAMYKTNKITPVDNPLINKYIAVSEIAKREYEEITNKKCDVIRNPLTFLESDKQPVLFLISATRLTEEKGKEYMIEFSKKLDESGCKWLWLIFTNDTNKIDNDNIVYMPPRLDIRPYLQLAKGKGYGVQFSKCEGDCYFTRECEAIGLPLLITPLPSFQEQNLVDGENCYYIPFDMNIDDKIDKIINNIPEYEPYIRNDTWDMQLDQKKSNYEEEKKMKVKVRCVKEYYDLELKVTITPSSADSNYERIVTRERADVLEDLGLVEVLGIVKEEVETATKPKKSTKTVKKQPKKETAVRK